MRSLAVRRTVAIRSIECRPGIGFMLCPSRVTTRAKAVAGSGFSKNWTVPFSSRTWKKLSAFPSGQRLMSSASSRLSRPSSASISLVTRSPAPARWTAAIAPSVSISAASVDPPPRSSTTSGLSVPGVVRAPRTAISASTPPTITSTLSAPLARSRSDTAAATACIPLSRVRTMAASATAFSSATSPATPPRTSWGTKVSTASRSLMCTSATA